MAILVNMRIIIFGPPGVGKGTASAFLIKEFSLTHISSGDIIRDIIKENKPESKLIKPYIDSGSLVPDKIITEIIEHRLLEDDCKPGFVLDGFPRTIPQAKFLDIMLKKDHIEVDHVIELTAPDDVIVERLSGRRLCKSCNAIYHIKTMPPKKEGVCDACGGELIQRKDDNEKVIRQRVSLYHKETEPLINYYKSSGLLREISADRPPGPIADDIKKLLTKK